MVTKASLNKGLNSALSLQPLILVLRKMIAEGKPGARKLYGGLIQEIESKPYLLQPINDPSVVSEDSELVESLLSTIFPPSTTSNQGIHAITFPFRPETIYTSPAFRELFLSNGSGTISFADTKTSVDVSKASMAMKYALIFRKFYQVQSPLTTISIHPYPNENGLTRYYELRLNAQFVDVRIRDEHYQIPESFNPQQALEPEELQALLPLEQFQFEGLMVIEVNDVTSDQVIQEIKNNLLNINSFSDVSVFDELQGHVQSLIGLKSVQIGITPFFKMNNYYLHTESLYKNSLLFRHANALNHRDKINNLCQQVFQEDSQPILYEILNDASTVQNRLLEYYHDQGAKSLILCPLKNDEGLLIGLLEVLSLRAGQLQYAHLAAIQPAIPLFALALEKSAESLELQIDKMIKEHFTAVQPAVEWKFTEAAFQYLQNRQVSELAKMPTITFDEVYPLYAAIDVRNSSTERNSSIQKDLVEQLKLASELLQKAAKVIEFPLLQETRYRIEKYMDSVSENLLSDDEMVIYDFLQNDLHALLESLKLARPELKKMINGYLQALDPQRKVIYHHRRNYEESITRINDVLDRFIDSEQHEAQQVYPHYFERYVTDGIEFNIYVGQSLSPQLPFDELYVRNLKLWQLTMLAKAARLTHALEQKLTIPLQTTQLILAHSIPLSISFRRKERKFDVDGAYNIRYEIVKKRIDKVHIRDTDERLTQPGTVAIVYSQNKELEEYMEFIEFLQAEKLLGGTVEHYELEDTQGISGLKAIRVPIFLTKE
jgi:hypothetical protein